jgi:hypothetical protein
MGIQSKGDNTMPLNVRYGTTLPIAIGLMAGSQLLLALTSSNQNLRPVQFIIAGLGILLAVLLNLKPYFTVDEKTLTLYGAFGLFNRKFQYDSLMELKVDGTRLTYMKDGQWQAISVAKGLANAQDWATLEKLLVRA